MFSPLMNDTHFFNYIPSGRCPSYGAQLSTCGIMCYIMWPSRITLLLGRSNRGRSVASIKGKSVLKLSRTLAWSQSSLRGLGTKRKYNHGDCWFDGAT